MAGRPLAVGRVDRAAGAVPARPKRVVHPLVRPTTQHLLAGAVPVGRQAPKRAPPDPWHYHKLKYILVLRPGVKDTDSVIRSSSYPGAGAADVASPGCSSAAAGSHSITY